MLNKMTRPARTAVLAAFTLLAAGGVLAQAYHDSGYLDDYSTLTTEKDSYGVERRLWVSPEFNGAKYKKLLVSDVTYYPQPQGSDKVPMSALMDIETYMSSAARKAAGPYLTSQAGPGVARVEIAITAARIEGAPLKPYELIPAAFVIHAVSQAAGAGSDDAKLAVESRITDSVTGVVLARIVREAKGVELPSNQALSLSLVQRTIDEWAAAAASALTTRLGAGQ